MWIVLLLGALVCSGVAGIVNQVVWQRALKIYLAGSEAVSAMIVVAVFMLGLGIGSQWAGRLTGRSRNPLFTLAMVEIGLALVNTLVCFLLSLDLTESIYSFQRVVSSIGVPLRVLYAATAIALLTGPCLLMGMTVPFATEGCQRQLNLGENRFLSVLFFLNTAGAVIGAVVSGFYVLPIIGQQAGLQLAIGLNTAAGLMAVPIALKNRAVPTSEPAGDPEAVKTSSEPGRGFRAELLVGFLLGFVSLAYEMYLFRIASLIHQPLPVNFSLVLALFLLTWSLGVGAARWLPDWIPLWLVLTGISMLFVPDVYRVVRGLDEAGTADVVFMGELNLKWIYFLLAFIPCVFFGILFTQVVARFAQSWGSDVGRYFAWNTFGSCAGIFAGTLVGFEFAPEYTVWTLALAVIVIWLASRSTWRQPADPEAGQTPPGKSDTAAWVALAGFLVVGSVSIYFWNERGRTMEGENVAAAYYGPGGVILIDRQRNLEWDGLWHSALSDGRDHIGTNNWKMASIPLLCRTKERCPDVCVVGLGTGITAATAANSSAVDQIDVYEINDNLKEVLTDYPTGTLNVATNPKIKLYWQDGRSGLALREKKYDLITQQPLYLKQAGSSILLSREYMQLVKSRLKPHGLFCIYCNSQGNAEQARVVRNTARSVFKHCESFWGGYMLVVSQQPFQFNREIVEQRLANDPVLRKECEMVGLDQLAEYHDAKRLSWKAPFLITDDHPLIEYRDTVKRLVQQAEQ